MHSFVQSEAATKRSLAAIPRSRRLRCLAEYVVVRVFICIVQAVRIETCDALARGLAWFAADVLKLRGDVVDDNIRHAYPELTAGERRRMARRMWRHLILMVCEIAHVPRKVRETTWRRYVSLPHKQRMMRYLLDPRATVLVTGHFGNFEVAGYLAGMLGFPTFTIARPLDNPYLDAFVNRFRSAKGQFILPKVGSAAPVADVLEHGGTLSLLADQYAGPKGCWVDFMGRPASCHKALALFTLTSGAPMVVTYNRRLARPMQFELGVAGIADPAEAGDELANVRALTQWYNQALERAVALAPEQYWWVHRRWKGEPPQRAKRAASATDGIRERPAA